MNNKYNMDDKFNLDDEETKYNMDDKFSDEENKKDEEIEVLDLWEPHAEEITDAKDRHIKTSKKTTNRVVMVLVAVGALLLMWYATFAQPLASNNKQYEQRGTLNVDFLREYTVSKTGKVMEVKEPNFSNKKVNFYISFAEAGDKIVYNLTIQNKGNLDAKIKNIDPPINNLGDKILYSVSGVQIGDVLKAGQEAQMQFTAIYTGGVAKGETYSKDMSVSIDYEQA